MADALKTNWIQRIKKEPMANSILNNKIDRYVYDTYEFSWNAGNNAYQRDNNRILNDRRSNSLISDKYIYDRTIPANQPIEPGIFRVGNAVHFHNMDNPNKYWDNIAVDNLYNLKTVNTPNPVFNLLRKSPIHISSIHQTFSS